MWSKNRPIRHSGVTPLTDEQRRAANWGYTFTQYSSISALLNAAVALGGACAWNYPKPEGLPNSPFRLTDFVNYEHDRRDPPFGWKLNKITVGYYDQLFVTSDGDEYFAIEDFPSFEGYKIGVAMRKQGQSSISLVIAPADSIEVIDKSLLTAGIYDVCFFLSPTELDAGDIEKTGVYYLLPYPHSICAISNDKGWRTDAWTDHLYTDRLEFDLSLWASDVRTIRNVKVAFRRPNHSPADPPQAEGEADCPVGDNIIVPDSVENAFRCHITLNGVNGWTAASDGTLYIVFTYGRYYEQETIIVESSEYE